MSSPTRLLLGLLCVAAVVVLALVLLDDTGQHEVSPDAAGAPSEDSQQELTTLPDPSSSPSPQPLDVSSAGLSKDEELGEERVAEAALVAETPVASLRGRVVDHTGLPLAQVRVTYMPSERETERWPMAGSYLVDLTSLPVVLSDAGGRFALEIPWSGPPAGLRWRLAPDLILDAEGFALRAVPCSGLSAVGLDLGDLQLEPGGVLRGRIVDERERPMPQVSVAILQRSPQPAFVDSNYRGSFEAFLHVTTDAAGRFRSRGLFPGRLGYEISAAGWTPVVTFGIELGSGEDKDLGDIVLSRGASLAGFVLDAQGEPVVGAQVHAATTDFRTAFVGFDPGDSLLYELSAALEDLDSAHGQTDEQGFFELAGLKGGSLTLYVEADGFEVGKLAGLPANERDALLTLQRPASLRVQVQDASTGQGIPAAEVQGHRAGFQVEPELEVEPLGAGGFLLHGAGPVANRLSVAAPGYARVSVEAAGVPSAGEGQLTVALARGASLQGGVQGKGGRLLGGASIALDMEPTAETIADASGQFLLPSLQSGSWTLSVEAEGFAALERSVHLVAGEVQDLGVLVLMPGAQVDGRVQDKNAKPQSGVSVRLKGAADSVRTQTDTLGAFRFADLPAGSYSVDVPRGGHALLDLEAGQSQELVLVMRDAPRVVGHVRAGDSLLPEARVMLREDREVNYWGRELLKRLTTTNEQGEYALSVESVGPHLVSVTAPGGARMSVPVVLDWDEQRSVDVVFGSGTLAGLVLAEQGGAVVPAALVSIEPLETVAAQVNGRTTTDAVGRFSMPGLWPGTYQVRVRATGFAEASSGPHRLGDDTSEQELVIRMTAGAVLSGSITQVGVEVVPDGTEVLLRGVQGEPVAKAETEGGQYEFRDLPQGSFLLLVAEPGEGGGLGIEVFMHEEPVSLAAGERRRLDVALSEP